MILRGNVNIEGDNGNLTLQSDKWVYHEGLLNVTQNISVFGGMEADKTDREGANDKGSSVYMHPTAVLNTTQAGSLI